MKPGNYQYIGIEGKPGKIHRYNGGRDSIGRYFLCHMGTDPSWDKFTTEPVTCLKCLRAMGEEKK